MQRSRTQIGFLAFSITFALGSLATLFDIRFDTIKSEPMVVVPDRTFEKTEHRTLPNDVKPQCLAETLELESRSYETLVAALSDLKGQLRKKEIELVRLKARTSRLRSGNDPAILKVEIDLLELGIQIESRKLYLEQRSKNFGRYKGHYYQDLLYREYCLGY